MIKIEHIQLGTFYPPTSWQDRYKPRKPMWYAKIKIANKPEDTVFGDSKIDVLVKVGQKYAVAEFNNNVFGRKEITAGP